MADNATLSGYDAGLGSGILPVHFSYSPPAPKIRHTIHRTADGAFTLHHANNIGGASNLPADSEIEWRLEGSTRLEWFAMMNLYTVNNALETTRAFAGYWGEAMTVICYEISPPEVRATLFSGRGKFLVTAITSWGTTT